MRRQPSNVICDLAATETGGRRKKWKGRLPVAILFPNFYRLGMSNLGFQLVHDLANSHPDIVCERFFLPEDNSAPRSVESQRPLSDFPIILCSVSFEQDYPNLVYMLRAGGVEPRAAIRQQHSPDSTGFPLVIGGGVATFMNPEPLVPFIDLFVVGEAEPVLPGLLSFLVENRGNTDRQRLLGDIAKDLPGCYAPHFYEAAYNQDGTLASVSGPDFLPARIKKVVVPPGSAAAYSRILSPHAEFSDMFLAELGRGCSRGCRFCAAGFIYRPPRLWSGQAVVDALAQRPENSKRVGLLGVEMARPDDLDTIAGYLLDSGCSLSFSSLRADVVGSSLMDLLAASGLKSAALAPDGGSERLRRVINKGFSEDDILLAAEALAKTGIGNLKLYFMIGLPTETMDDLEEMIGLIFKVKEILLKVGKELKRVPTLTPSINCFIPKPWTPFQFAPFAPIATLKKKLTHIRKRLTGQANMKILADSPDKAYFQAVLARGDRRVGEALFELVRQGRNWRHQFNDLGLDPGFYAMRERGREELFPWEILDHSIHKGYLWDEYQKALGCRTTTPCDVERCRRCGVCREK